VSVTAPAGETVPCPVTPLTPAARTQRAGLATGILFAMDCAEILSEDVGDGQDHAGVRVINSFR
jgi:hypothetical protein